MNTTGGSNRPTELLQTVLKYSWHLGWCDVVVEMEVDQVVDKKVDEEASKVANEVIKDVMEEGIGESD